MTGNDDDAVFRPRIFRDDVVHRKLSFGRGVPQAIDKLEQGKIDALVIFSDEVKQNVTGNSAYADLVVSNAQLGSPHLLGTDTQGRDIFSHIINGGTSLILTAVLAGLFSTVIAVILGALAALIGGQMVDPSENKASKLLLS